MKQIVFLWNTFYVLSSLDRNTHSCAQKFKFKCRWIFKMSDDTATSSSCWVKFFKFLQCVNTQKRKRTQNLSFFFSFHCISLREYFLQLRRAVLKFHYIPILIQRSRIILMHFFIHWHANIDTKTTSYNDGFAPMWKSWGSRQFQWSRYSHFPWTMLWDSAWPPLSYLLLFNITLIFES